LVTKKVINVFFVLYCKKKGYNFNKLTSIEYPQNPENNVYYEYGEANSGNQAGRIVKQQDAAGVQTFNYGKLGELIENNRTFVMPNSNETYTFNMRWQYDSWNRLKNITYPDGETVSYTYNRGGQLYSMAGDKTGNTYSYIDNIRYNKYEKRTSIKYGNNTNTNYIYNPLTLQLSQLQSFTGAGELMQDIKYDYDDVNNIVAINNYANTLSNGIGGVYSNTYKYDENYRLFESYGNYNGTNNFALSIGYTPSGNIDKKVQSADVMINGSSQPINYNRKYNYDVPNKPHCVGNITEGGNVVIKMQWDDNGNMKFYGNEAERISRNHCWDEENRLSAVGDNNYLSLYTYDAAGERVWKQTGQIQQMQVNANQIINFAELTNNTLYANPYMVATDQEYTKHYYIEGQRIASKIGGGFDNDYSQAIFTPIEHPIVGDYGYIMEETRNLNRRKIVCVEHNPDNVNYAGELRGIYYNLNQNNYEENQYFYHSDHLGSGSFITDATGNAIQHLQYLPYGEAFIDQRTTDYNSRYKFSAKEKDEETNYGYFGARYYLSDISIWASVDPLADERSWLSPYNYCQNNPIMLTDPDGMLDDEVEGGSKNDNNQNNYVNRIEDFKLFDNFLSKELLYQEKEIDNSLYPDDPPGYILLPEVTIKPKVKKPSKFKTALVDFYILLKNSFNWWYDNLGLGNKGSESSTSEKMIDVFTTSSLSIFIGGIKMDKEIFHRKYKTNILKKVGIKNYIKKVGKSPNINVVNDIIVLEGQGPFRGKNYPTSLKASEFLIK